MARSEEGSQGYQERNELSMELHKRAVVDERFEKTRAELGRVGVVLAPVQRQVLDEQQAPAKRDPEPGERDAGSANLN